ncbi:recombinase family protein [Streptomyces sp. NPDC006355]|uniref:recombinase family protein n=1 Tax=Streptomyces sp. NPDC006355 TaxID=3156758 RepID=UPI0033A8D4E9
MPTTEPNATADECLDADARSHWAKPELEELDQILSAMEALPADAPRALLSVRLSVWTDDTTSPVRQEIDLYRDALAAGYRVVGVARDLNVSATKVAPWKRKQLGHWLKERTPEFDVLIFWKYDRFIRNYLDLSQMIRWAQEHTKNLVSVQEKLDLTTVMGQFLANALALVAQIEAANTGTRVESLWEHSRKQEDRWYLGSPVYGYTTVEADKGKKLVPHPTESRVVGWMAAAYLRGKSGLYIAQILNRAKVPAPSGGGSWQSKTVIRILKNPAITGVRVRLPHGGKKGDTPVPSYGNDGRPVMVAGPLVSESDFQAIKQLIEGKARKRGANTSKSPFLGVLKHAPCGMNVTKHVVKQKYQYLRCVSDSMNPCGHKIPGWVKPAEVYGELTHVVLEEIGQYQVIERYYVRGQQEAARAKHLQDTVQHYMKELAPGGQFSDGGFMEQMAKKNLAEASAELNAIDPSTLTDRWEYKRLGQTFAERWQEGGANLMQEDLIKAGVTAILEIDEEAEDSEDRVSLSLYIPKDVEERLIMKPDAFASPV